MNGPPSAFIDIGANLLDEMFQARYNGKEAPYHPADLDTVLQRAWDTGVRKIIITAGNLEEAKAALALARTDERLFCTVGVHPTRCNEFESYKDGSSAYLAALKEVIIDGQRDNKVVAVGECGLDYDRLNFCEAATQRRWFEAQFELAKTSNLPMFLHLRAASDDFLEIVHRHAEEFPAGVVHSFDGTAADLEIILKIKKLHIGVNGCSLKTEENLSVAAAVPIERLHFETDAPWCDIRPSHAGASSIKTIFASKDRQKYDAMCLVKGRNEPCTLVNVCEIVAAAKGVDARELAAQVLQNSEAMFFNSASTN